jgi:hypothetical protein
MEVSCRSGVLFTRRRVRRGLLKGEQLHALARHVHYGKQARRMGGICSSR